MKILKRRTEHIWSYVKNRHKKTCKNCKSKLEYYDGEIKTKRVESRDWRCSHGQTEQVKYISCGVCGNEIRLYN